MNKFLILKGIEGFGDRLECLLQAIEYCEKSERTLVIDWRDTDWIQEKNDRIENYFNIQNIKTQSINNFNKETKTIKSINPATWKNVLKEKKYQDFIYNKEYNHENNNVFYTIAKSKQQDFNEQIIVSPGVYLRNYDAKYFNYIKFDQKIYDKCKRIQKKHGLIPGEYNCIHIRHKNKTWSGGYTTNNTLRRRMHGKFLNQKIMFQFLKNKYKNIKKDIPTIIIGDCAETVKQFNQECCNNECINLCKIKEKTNGLCGVHKTIDEKKKRQKNIDCLVDFHLMLHSRFIINDEISLFSNMAKLIKNHISI